jgi:hypothetical protein
MDVSSTFRSRLTRLAVTWSRPTVAALLIAIVLVLMAKPVITMPFFIPKNYNEGWNAFQAMRAMGHEPLYPGSTALTVNNYPPLSFYVVGIVGSFWGNNIFAGRIIALLAFAAVAALTAVITSRVCGSRYAGLVAGLLFAGYLARLHPDYIGMNDPQWLAQALMTVALMLALAHVDGNSHAWVLPVVLVALASGLVKHSVIPFPLALTIWFALYDRRGLFAWVGCASLVLALALGALYWIYGPDFFRNVVGFHRTYAIHDILPKVARWALPLLPLFAAFGAFVWLEPSSRTKQILVIYTVTAGVWGVYALGGAGVNMNVMYDFMVGLTIVAGVMVNRIGERLQRLASASVTEAAAVVLVAIGMLGTVPRQALALPTLVASLGANERRFAADVGYVAAVPGPAACQSLALCYWARKPFEFDMFVVGQNLQTGAMNAETFDALIERHYFKVFEMSSGGALERLPRASIDRIREHYELGRSGVLGEILIPRVKTAMQR